MSPERTLVDLHGRLLRRSTLILSLLFLAGTAGVTAGYEGLYSAGSDRSAAVALGQNPGFRAILGSGAGLDTPGGFVAWRFGGPAVVIVAVWAYLVTTRLLRGEEEAGRVELVRAGAVTTGGLVRSVMVVTSAATLVLGVGIAAGMVLGGAPIGGSVLTGAAIITGAFVFGAFGIVAAQVLPTRRAAALTSGGAVVLAFLVRAIANVRGDLAWMRWVTPLGWNELVRPFGDRTLLPLAVAAVATALLAAAGAVLAGRRDLGAALLADDATRTPRRTGLQTSLGLTVRQVLPRTLVWVVPLLVLSTTFGLLSKDIGDFFETNATFADVFSRFGVDPSLPVRAFIGFVASTFSIVGVCFAVAEVSAAREEESTGRLDNLLALAVPRRRWFLGHLALTSVGVVLLAVALAVGAGAGTSWSGAKIEFADFTSVAVNAVPVGVLFLGLTALVFAVAPRLTSSFGFGLVGVAFVWQILGSAVRAPQWSLDLSPFSHVAAVPAQGMNVGAALVLTGLGVAAALAGVEVFVRRDIHEG